METKKCKKCNEVKPLDEFRENHKMKDGHLHTCKKCENIRNLKYIRSKDGVVKLTYDNQIRHSMYRNHPLPYYTKGELREWLFSQLLFHELYDKWVESGYDRWIKPSVDRIDDYKPYSLDNIQLMTSKDNVDKGHKDRKSGINNKMNKAVLQYDLEGRFIKEYHSIAFAARETGLSDRHIGCVCVNKRNKAGGFIWKYRV